MKKILILFFGVMFLTPSVFAQLLPQDNGKVYQNARNLKKATVTPSTTIPVWNVNKNEWESVTADSLMTATVVASLPTSRNPSKKQFLNRSDSSDFQLVNDSVYYYKTYKGSVVPSVLSTTFNAGITVGGKGISVTYKITPETNIDVTHETTTGYVTTYRLQRDNKTIKPVNTPQFSSLANVPLPENTVSGITTSYKGFNVYVATDSSEYTPQYLDGTKVLRWHRVTPTKVYSSIMPADSVLINGQYFYNNRARVIRYGLSFTTKDYTEYINNGSGWQPIKGYISVIDFGYLSSNNPRKAAQLCIDSAIAVSGQKQGFIQVVFPQSDFTFDSTLFAGKSNQFSQLLIVGAGKSYRGQFFRGTVIRAAFSNMPLLDVPGASRETIIEGISFVGPNDYTLPTGSSRSNVANYIKSGLAAGANSRYAPCAAITTNGMDSTVSPRYVNSPQYHDNSRGSAVAVRDCYFYNWVVGVVSQPGNTDGNGDFLKVQNCGFDHCVYDVSVCQTQARNTIIDNCQGYGEYTCFTTVSHGRQNGRINLISNYSGGGCYQSFNIGNLSVNSSLFISSFYTEDAQRLGVFGTNSSGNSSVVFNGGLFQGDAGSSPSSGVTTSILESNGMHNIIFNAFTFSSIKHLHFNNTSNTKVKLNDCTVLTEPLFGELAGTNPTDTQRLFFRRVTQGVTASEMWGLEINSTRFSDGNTYYFTDDFGLRGNNRLVSNLNFSRINAHEGYNIKIVNQSDPSIFNASATWARGLIDNRNCNFVGRRFAFNTNSTANKIGMAKGDLFMCTGVSAANNSLVLMIDTVRADSIILTLMNNYNYNPSTGAFISYVVTPSGGAGSPLSGNNYWYTGRAFVSIQPIMGYFTLNSPWVTGLTKADGTAQSNTVFDKSTPLFGGKNSRLYPYLDELTSIDFVSTTGTDSIHMTRGALRTGIFPVGNTFTSEIYPYINFPSQPSIVGFAALSGGTVTVSEPRITNGMKIVFGVAGGSGINQGFLRYSLNPAVGFTITSSNALDGSTVAYTITQ